MHTSNWLSDTHMENKILPLPSRNSEMNILDESTRKRKLTAADKHETSSEIDFKYSFSKKSNLLLPKSFHYVGSLPLNKLPVGETLKVSNRPMQAHNLFGQAERLILPPLPDSCSAQAGKSTAVLGLQDIMGFGHKSFDVADNQSLKVQYSSSGNLGPSDLVHHCFVGSDELPVASDGNAGLLENDQILNTAGSSYAVASLEPYACTKRSENDRSLQNKIAVGNSTAALCLSGKLREDNENCGDGNIKMMKQMKGSNSNSSLVQRISLNKCNNPADAVIKNYQITKNGCLSKSSDEKSLSLAGKLAPTTSEKLWDGSIQLNSSVTVSAVAFFKSGEKMPDINWCDVAEVKGKVRLEAFERYIQDLSHSRNRGLMVISLCWKEGSSKSGLVGMKKVAKGYREEGRVGIVKLSPGVDLYVCPCSDTIITILAKHGFFKGMAAVVDNKDSLIGCVVWRKNGASNNSATKKSDRNSCSLSEHPFNSSSSSSNQRFAEKNLSSMQPVQESILSASETEISTLESTGTGKTEGKHMKSSEVQLGLQNSSASADLSLTSVLKPERFTDSKCAIDSASVRGSMSESSDVEAPLRHKSSMERPEHGVELQKPAFLACPSGDTKQPKYTLDDDDLPEFDFRTACGKSQSPMSECLNAATVDKKFLTNRQRKMAGSMQLTVPTVHSLSAFNKQRSEICNRAMVPLDDIQRMPVLKKVSTHEESQITQSRGILMPVSAAAVTSKNLFNGDNSYMPERCPPYTEPWKLLVPRITSASTAFVSSKVPSSVFGSSCSLSSPLLVTHPPFTTYAIPCENHCSINASVKVVQPRLPDRYVQSGPRSSVGLETNPLLRTRELPIHPAGWKGWRP